MREPLRKVAYLMEVPFTARDVVRLGAQLYQNAGLEVEVLDLQPLLHPGRPDSSEPEGVIEKRPLSTMAAVRAALNGFGPDVMLINLLARNAAALPVAKALRACRALCVEVRTNAVPSPGSGGLRRRLARLTPRKVWDALARILLWPWVARRPDIIIYGGEVMRPASYEAARLVSAHALDYDLFLEKAEPQSEEPYITFIDQHLPFHPDFNMLKSAFPVTPEQYYPSLRAFFDVLEAHTGMPVIIAAHPRAEYEGTARLFGNRRVVGGRTLELVRHASLVLLHYSTALNFAILANTPMLFLSTNELERAMGPTIAAMAALTGRPVLNVDRLPEEWSAGLLEVDARAYAAYCRRYIKEPRTPEKPFWQILLDAANGTRESRTPPFPPRPAGMKP